MAPDSNNSNRAPNFPPASARARASCSRCHKRKKSFEDDDLQTASYPIAYIRSLEEKLKLLGHSVGVGECASPGNGEQTTVPGANCSSGDLCPSDSRPVNPTLADQSKSIEGNNDSEIVSTPVNVDIVGPGSQGSQTVIQDPPIDKPSTFEQELSAISLEAAAERYLGSTAGLSFARLTQMILRRLTPDKLESPSDLFNDTFFQSLGGTISIHPLLFGDVFLSDLAGFDDNLDSLAWPSDETYIGKLVDFYFAHSHTLYPILKRSEVMDTLAKIRNNPQSLATQPPLDVFRIWMVLAIGSTAYSSVMLTEESESMLFYSKAMQYSEKALEGDEMPPSVVSITLGRPFAIHDDDIDASPFEGVDEELIHPDRIDPQSCFQPSLMVVPLHILSLRRIASRISRQVYGNPRNDSLSVQEREAIVETLHQELLNWRRSMPFPLPDFHEDVPHLSTSWYDFNHYTHLAMIYRPSPLFPVSDVKRIKMLEMAASMSLRSAFSMHQQRKFAYNWLNFLSIFTATLSVVYAATTQPDDLGAVLKESRAIADLDLAAQLFETFALKFPAAHKVQSMIAEISRRYKEILATHESVSLGYI
ncbi:hypothetical protein FSARC_12597 [Fusarium sarcochroum]|uniref:Uncharacterized protein n=1 Tax=Fusarium sarcochroum TaxID=1208366 RepID=A0A8H4T7A8_9HYPO|nr:hypothetical protein FSARC_12597 [Fusarium sarcochroum]